MKFLSATAILVWSTEINDEVGKWGVGRDLGKDKSEELVRDIVRCLLGRSNRACSSKHLLNAESSNQVVGCRVCVPKKQNR